MKFQRCQHTPFAAKEIVQVAASSATVQEAKANLYILEDLVKSDEFKDLLQNGVFEALNIGKQESFAALGPQFDNFNMAMMGDGFFKPIERRWEALTSDLGRIESRFKRYRSDLPNPFEEGLSAQEQRLRAVDWLVERVPEHAEHFDHYSDCRNTLLVHKSPEDLLTLCKKDHMILTPDRMEDVAPKLANSKCRDNSGLFEDNVIAITKGDDRFTVIPKYRAEVLEGQDELRTRAEKVWFANSEDSMLDGVVRHELGQSLGEYLDWNVSVRSDPAMNLKYLSARDKWQGKMRRLMTEHQGLQGGQSLSGEVEATRESIGEELRQHTQFAGHFLGNDYGLEQTLADLYAIQHGGSKYDKQFEQGLLEIFSDLNQALIEKNWYRK